MSTQPVRRYGLLITGIVLGISYGLATRFIFGREATLASLTYLFVIPTLLGMVPFMFTDSDTIRSYRNIIFIPWLTIATFFLTLLLAGVEDFLCLIVLAAPFFLLATLGAFIFRLVRINRKKRSGTLLTILLLPFLLSPVEEYIQSPSVVFTATSTTVIAATPQTVWNNIVEVPTIRPDEYSPGLFNTLGIPRPISATVDTQKTGGHRTGRFEGGLTFRETITTYQPRKLIAFSIAVDTASVRPRVFDQHVLRGNYFTFVDATYELTELSDHQTRLTLSSRYKLTSKINLYGKFWGDIILQDFQDRLLKVVRHRCTTKE